MAASSRSQHRRRNKWGFNLVFRGTIVVAALGLGWIIFGNTVADNLARTDPTAALTWRPELPSALMGYAEQLLVDDSPPSSQEEIQQLASRALISSPLDDSAIRTLALVAEKNNDMEKADELMRLADERSRRDATTQIWLFNHLARLGEFDGALEHADALLRSRGYLNDEIAPTLVAFALDSEARQALVRMLSENPPWRSWYLRLLARRTDDPGTAYVIYAALQDGKNPPSDAELASYLQSLVNDQQYDRAYLAWIAFLPKERSRSIHYAYNGDFEYPISGLPFDWSIDTIKGATTEIVEVTDRDGGHAVRIEFANRRVPYRHLRKLLMLPPGTYQLTGDVRTRDLENERGLVWQVSCAEKRKDPVLGESPAFKDTIDWQQFETRFEVPDDCRAQWLTLVLAAEVALEEQVSGEAWFDNLAVTRSQRKPNETSAVN